MQSLIVIVSLSLCVCVALIDHPQRSLPSSRLRLQLQRRTCLVIVTRRLQCTATERHRPAAILEKCRVKLKFHVTDTDTDTDFRDAPIV